MAVEFESTKDMSAECAQGLRHLLLACADTKLLLGYHYGEWTFGTPELEAAVASCSLAQAELGHVRLLHAILAKHCGVDPDHLVDGRAPTEFANISFLDRPIPDWPAFVAMNYVVDLAVARTLHALRQSSFVPVRVSVDKMLDEERYHLHHGRGWLRTMAGRGDETREALEGYVHAALGSIAEWFGPNDEPEDQALVAADIKAMDNRGIHAAVVQDVTGLAREVGLAVRAGEAAGFGDWTPGNRRIGGGRLDDEILFHLRGSKNEVFKLS